jgi:hypothetical protein
MLRGRIVLEFELLLLGDNRVKPDVFRRMYPRYLHVIASDQHWKMIDSQQEHGIDHAGAWNGAIGHLKKEIVAQVLIKERDCLNTDVPNSNVLKKIHTKSTQKHSHDLTQIKNFA